MLEARKIYYKYHIFLFPTLSENYGHVIAESIIANCIPVITEGTTPWDDLKDNGGYIYTLNNIKQLTSYLQELVDMDNDELNYIREKLDNYKEDKLKISELISKYSDLINISDVK